MKQKSSYICASCGARTFQWQGQCPKCRQWGSLELEAPVSGPGLQSAAQVAGKSPVALQDIPGQEYGAFSIGSRSVDFCLGSGLMPGSGILLGGEPGVGKSTFLLQLAAGLVSSGRQAVYVSGEESQSQIKARSERLGLGGKNLQVLASTRLEDVLGLLQGQAPDLLIIDSVQTLVSEQIQGLPGSVSQVRNAASLLLEGIKQSKSVLMLVGHVTKEGQIAGPRLLEHMVDTVLYLEGDKQHMFRLLRVVKNRFGPAGNILVLRMTAKGLQIVQDPSTFFLQDRDPQLSGTALVMALEGQRALAVEVQALVTDSFLPQPRRTALGLDANRLPLLLAIMEKRMGLNMAQQEVYAKLGAGLRLQEPGLDLGLAAAILSSFRDQALPRKAVFWGEVDLNGQVRPVLGQDLRLKQARSLGYKPIVCPAAGLQEQDSGQDLQPVSNVLQLQDLFAS
ncbi:MAG: DNA repair protein RadA [Desulfohalobiaceae bacterium]